MNPTVLISLATLWSVVLAYQVNEKEPLPPKLPLRPGDLLRSLDELTSDAQIIHSPAQVPAEPSADRRVYDSESPYDHPDSEYDYDKAYEDFVSKYFAQGQEDLESDDEEEKAEDIEDTLPFESKTEKDEVEHPKQQKRSSKSKKCKRVEINGENCFVCEDPKTNAKSKSCSYGSESKPKSYGFSRQRSTKRNKDNNDDDDDDDGGSAEAGRSVKRETAENHGKLQPRMKSNKALLTPSAAVDVDESSKCVRKKEDAMICYYCGTSAENTRECMADKNNPKKRRLNESSKKDSKTKKVYKRMVKYSYKNDGEPKVLENTYAAFKGY